MKSVFAVGVLFFSVAWARAEEKPPSYVRDVKPILAKYCVRCHQPQRAKAKLDLTSVEAMLKPAKRGKVMLTPGKPEGSRIVATMEGARPVMPPAKAKQPTRQEIALIRTWVAAGAKDDSKTD
jgi:mono/diheme cytochrome c family protein